nr:retrovirus-related Pol polyprotein from transposon TNT 1-94 [Tanacetum cinerariifolium]
MQMVRGNDRNQFRQYAWQNARNPAGYNDVIGNQNQIGNGNLVAARAEGNAAGQNGNQIRCYNCKGVGHYARDCTVRPKRRDAAYLQTQLLIAQKEEAGIQLQVEEYDLMAAAADLDEIKEVSANCILMANSQQSSTSGTQTDSAPVYDSDGSAKALELEIKRLLKAVVSQDIMIIVQNESVVDTSDLQTELERMKKRFENSIIKKETEYAKLWNDRPQPRSNTKNDRVPSASKSSRSQNKEAEVEEHHRNLLLSKNNKHISSACNNIKIDSQDVISKVVCAMCKKCLISVNQDKCLSKNVNGKNSCGKNQKVIQICLRSVDSGYHVAAILGFGDLQWGNILITRVYFVEGLGHNLFSVGQFCDSDLEVAFRRNACFIRNLEGVDLLKGDRSTNLYTINLQEMASASPICLMARASSTKSWLWHQRLSHLNFDTINDLARNDLVAGLPKFKYHKEHLFPSCEPMRIASINGKR